MFGYVTINKNELKIKDYDRYRSFYCGLCYSLKNRFGVRGQLILQNDMTFLDLLLNGLYEKSLEETKRRCIAHPTSKHHMVYNEITDYAADMSVLLAYYKLLDDRIDEGKLAAGALAGRLKRSAEAAASRWPRQADAIKQYILDQAAFEKSGSTDLDSAAQFTGVALGEIFVMTEDEWSDVLRRMGFFLGKFIYLMDAYDDLEKDVKEEQYNPWIPLRTNVDFDAYVENVLTMMMAECAKEFEKLPIVQDIDILRNIVYSGVWTKYAILKQKKESEGAEEHL